VDLGRGSEMENELNYNEVFKFMVEFEIDFINRYGELIIDQPTNTYTTIKQCKDIEDVKTHVVFSLCRPIGKGLENKPATRLLKRVNNYFNVNLTKEDMRLMYGELCYTSKLDELKSFIKRGFPMSELTDHRIV
jgi:hypothetical protein